MAPRLILRLDQIDKVSMNHLVLKLKALVMAASQKQVNHVIDEFNLNNLMQPADKISIQKSKVIRFFSTHVSKTILKKKIKI